MKEIEIEKTYLAKYVPEELLKFESKDLLDLYVPAVFQIGCQENCS